MNIPFKQYVKIERLVGLKKIAFKSVEEFVKVAVSKELEIQKGD